MWKNHKAQELLWSPAKQGTNSKSLTKPLRWEEPIRRQICYLGGAFQLGHSKDWCRKNAITSWIVLYFQIWLALGSMLMGFWLPWNRFSHNTSPVNDQWLIPKLNSKRNERWICPSTQAQNMLTQMNIKTTTLRACVYLYGYIDIYIYIPKVMQKWAKLFLLTYIGHSNFTFS